VSYWLLARFQCGRLPPAFLSGLKLSGAACAEKKGKRTVETPQLENFSRWLAAVRLFYERTEKNGNQYGTKNGNLFFWPVSSSFLQIKSYRRRKLWRTNNALDPWKIVIVFMKKKQRNEYSLYSWL
jgi:hypothetical protein